MITYLNSFFIYFFEYLEYIGENIGNFSVLLYIISLVTIASAVDYIRRLITM